jgi:hypothetical protein
LISSSRIERLRPRVFCTEVEVVEEELIFPRGCEKLMEEGESPSGSAACVPCCWCVLVVLLVFLVFKSRCHRATRLATLPIR